MKSLRSIEFVCTAVLIAVCAAMPLTAAAAPFEIEAAGDLDLAFNGTGKTTLDIATGFDRGAGVVVQADNKIVVVGNGLIGTAGTQSQIELARYNVDGTLDATFDGDGIVTTSLFTRQNVPAGIFITPDQKIWVFGKYQFSASNSNYVGFLVRYTPNGALDTSFAAGAGFVQVLMDTPGAMAIDASGKILVAGSQSGSPTQARLQRFNADGSIDTPFGVPSAIASGTIQLFYDANPSGVNYTANAIVIQPDGKYVVGGTRGTGSSGNYGLARINPDATYDATFDTDGRLATAGSGVIRTLALQPDLKIVAMGTLNENFNATRYNIDGSLDTTFGSSTGRVSLDLLGSDSAAGGYLQPDGKIVVGGGTGGVNADFGVARFTSDGVPDLTFSVDGKQNIDFAGNADTALGVAADSLGRIILSGQAVNSTVIGTLRLAADAASTPVSISGTVRTPAGQGLRNASVILTNSQGIRRTATTSSFGVYSFGNVAPGETYTMTVSSKRYRFAPQIVTPTGNLTGVDFTGLE